MTNFQAQTTGQKPGAVDQATHDAAVAAARAEGEKAGAAAAMSRINAIIGCDEAKNRSTAATNLALKTSTSLEEAKAFLSGLPEEAAAVAPPQQQQQQSQRNVGDKGNGAQHAFNAAMAGSPDPGAQQEDEEQPEDNKAAAPPLASIMDLAYGVDRTKTKA